MSQEGILSDITSPAADVEFLQGDSGGPVGPDGAHIITITGNPDIEILGTPGLNNLQLTNLTKTTAYIVDSIAGAAPYQTVQSALDAANGVGGDNVVYVRPGTYNENLTLYDGIRLEGAGFFTIINGVHAPPLTGQLSLINLNLTSPTDILNSAGVGSSLLTLFQCWIKTTDGYIFNIPSWQASLRVFNCVDYSTSNGIAHQFNSNSNGLRIYGSDLGAGTKEFLVSNDTVLIHSSIIDCPVRLGNGVGVFSGRNGTIFTKTITTTTSGDAELVDCFFRTGSDVCINHTSTGDLIISECTFETSNANAITGTGTVDLASATFVDSDGFSGSLTFVEDKYLHTPELVSNNIERLKFSGFYEWTGAGSYYTVTGTDFTIDRPGSGYIKGRRVPWTGGQTLSSLAKGNTYYVYIDNTGTIGSSTVFSQTLYEDNIILFEVLVDNDTPANVLVVKENHPYSSPTDLSVTLHNTIGVVISNLNNGANIVAGTATDEIGISGADQLEDHGLETQIADSGGGSETWNFFYTDGGGKWVLNSTTVAFPSVYNNAGTITALTAGRYGVFRLYASKDDIETTTPKYIAVIDDAQYLNLNLAQTAVANGTVALATSELFELELAQLGFVIYEQSTSSIVDIIIEKGVVRGNTVTSGTNQASLVITNTTNFDGWLSASDTTVQQALETLDDVQKGTSFSGTVDVPTLETQGTTSRLSITNETISAIGTDTNIDIDVTPKGTGVLDVSSGVTSTNFTTKNVASALQIIDNDITATGTDTNIDVDITPKGTGVLDISSNDIHTTGVSFDTGTNVLDFYEEGTFTPTISFGGGSTGITYTTQVGTYTRIGNRVLFDIRIILTSKGTDIGIALVNGLPYSTNALVQYSLARWKNIDLTASYTIVSGRLSNGQSDINLQQVGDNVSPINVLDSDFSNDSDLYIEGTYRV